MQKATASLFLYTLHPKKKNNTYPVKIRITYLRKRRYYRTKIDLTKEQWEEVFIPGIRKYAETRGLLQAFEDRANEIIAELPFFTFEAFSERYYSKRANRTLGTLLENYENELRKQERHGTALSYKNTRDSFAHFKKDITLNELTPALFQKYEKWMLLKGRSLTTIGIYVRQVQTVINRAIADGLIKQEQYPFGDRRYVIPKGRGAKRYIAETETKKLKNYKPVTEVEQRCLDYYLFSYYGFGINMADILSLKNREIIDGCIVKDRIKTINTTRSNPKPLIVPISKNMENIIKRQGTGDKGPDDFVFPVLKGISDNARMHTMKRNFISSMDKTLKKIGAKLNIPISLSSYVARHSFSTLMVNKGFTKSQVGGMLGHGSDKTTENYFAGWDVEMLKKASRKL